MMGIGATGAHDGASTSGSTQSEENSSNIKADGAPIAASFSRWMTRSTSTMSTAIIRTTGSRTCDCSTLSATIARMERVLKAHHETHGEVYS